MVEMHIEPQETFEWFNCAIFSAYLVFWFKINSFHLFWNLPPETGWSSGLRRDLGETTPTNFFRTNCQTLQDMSSWLPSNLFCGYEIL